MKRIVDWLQKNTDFVLPIALFGIIVAIMIPLAPWIMDVLLFINIAFSFLLIPVTLYLRSPLQLSVFPTLLLIITFYRLALNIGTTRIILSSAATARPPTLVNNVPPLEWLKEQAGTVISTFGDFVGGGLSVVGIVVFIIILIVQFVVITKGATRIAEVAARFTLDAMPGKQMAIDADLNAGMIDEAEARVRREKISKEAEFFGAMDGAAKFVRGDAIASLIITVVNIVGGLLLATLYNDIPLAEAFSAFTLLTIGDGLVSAIPSLVVGLAAAFLITRTQSEHDVGGDIFAQLFNNYRAVIVVCIVLVVLMFTPFRSWQLIVIIGSLGGIALMLYRISEKEAEEEAKKPKPQVEAARPQEKVENLLHVDPMELEIGYGLIRIVDTKQGGDLLERITMIRRQVALDLGIIVPPVRIRDNMQLEPNQYAIKIRGTSLATGSSMVDHFLAMDSGVATGTIDGIPTTEPAFGLPAIWITESNKQRAEALGYTVVDATSVVATHLTEVIKNHAWELLSREDLSHLLENLKSSSPKIVEEVVGSIMKPGEVQRVLQNLLKERVSIRDLATILETLAEYAPRTKDPEILTEYVRNSLAPQICESYRSGDGKIHLVTLDPQLEDLVNANIERTEGGSYLKMAPALLNAIMDGIARTLEKLVTQGYSPILLCAPTIRSQVKKIVDGIQPGIAVLSYNEITRGVEVESVGMAPMPKEGMVPAR
ncbi:MAG: flagellar biosynthesis protein FlhA [Planctomycetes bacterium]|nr:flagellar biosynthesis protein FlhA [Planctomycetota bacterium]